MHVSNFRSVKRVAVSSRSSGGFANRSRRASSWSATGPIDKPLNARSWSTASLTRVDFVGEQHDVVSWLSASDLFLLPSAQESFGLAALEAMACEVPVIASHVGGLPEVIQDGVTGFIFEPDDVAGMAAQGIALLADLAAGSRDRARGGRGRAPPVLHECRGSQIRGVLRRGVVGTLTSGQPFIGPSGHWSRDIHLSKCDNVPIPRRRSDPMTRWRDGPMADDPMTDVMSSWLNGQMSRCAHDPMSRWPDGPMSL